MALFELEREKELQNAKQQQEEDNWKDILIQQEKERLLKEHLPYIDGFMPKGIVADEKDAKYFTNSKQFNGKQQTEFMNRNLRPTSLW